VKPHAQVQALLERAAKSPLPPYYDVPPHVSRRLYRDTRAAVSPLPPKVAESRLMLVPGPGGPVAVRAYRPEGAAADATLPALVFFHGGGWVIGDLDTHDVLCRQLANGAQCAVFSVDYRKAPEHPFPAGLDDCFAVVKHVAAEAKSLRVDATRIAVGGDSAGGNLAAVVSLLARDAGGPKLCFQLLIYPATDQLMSFPSIERNAEGYMLTKKAMQYFGGFYLPNEKDRHDWRASPFLAKSLAGLPRAFVLTAGFDPLVDEGRAYAERMAKEGVDVAYLDYPDMIHGFILMGGVLDTARAAVADCAERLTAAFADAGK
jgi:acetyl esterase